MRRASELLKDATAITGDGYESANRRNDDPQLKCQAARFSRRTGESLTGDALAVANDTARALGIGRIVRASELRAADAASKAESLGLTLESGGFAEVYPEDKFLVVKGLQTAAMSWG